MYRITINGLTYPDPADEPRVREAGGLTAFAAQVSAEVFATVEQRMRRPTKGETVNDIPEASVPWLLAQGWVEAVDEEPAQRARRASRTTRRREG